MTTLTPDETILGLIAIQASHGYELVELFRNSAALGDVWKMSSSQVYAVLKRLERQALIAGRVFTSENAPDRTEYYLTPAGQAQLAAWLDTTEPSASIRRIRVEFLSRLYIARHLNMPTIPIVLRQYQACQKERKRLIASLQNKEAGISYLALELVLAQLDAVMHWILRCELIPQDLITEIDDNEGNLP